VEEKIPGHPERGYPELGILPPGAIRRIDRRVAQAGVHLSGHREHSCGKMPVLGFEKHTQRFRTCSIATEEGFHQANCRSPDSSQSRHRGFSAETQRGRNPAKNRGRQSSQARDDAVFRRLPFRPNPTAPRDYAGKTWIGLVNVCALGWDDVGTSARSRRCSSDCARRTDYVVI
jgi:hypothetical protein